MKTRKILEEAISRGGTISIDQGRGYVCIFTTTSQHVYGVTLKEALKKVEDFIEGRRCWVCENWMDHINCKKHHNWALNRKAETRPGK